MSEIILPNNECYISLEYSYIKINKHCIIIEIQGNKNNMSIIEIQGNKDDMGIIDLYNYLLSKINNYIEYKNDNVILYNKIIYDKVIYHLNNLEYYISYSINCDNINSMITSLNELNIK